LTGLAENRRIMAILNRIYGIVLPGFLLLAGVACAQTRLYKATDGKTTFYSSTPAEDIRAENNRTQVILNTTTGEIAVLMRMRDFDFPNELMEEHFNENYVESEKYPYATFKGTLDKAIDFSQNGTFDASATGVFTVHGKSQNRTLKGKLTVQEGSIQINSDFEVPLSDHDIEVPKIVFVKIAQIIQVGTSYTLTPYKK
jgi:polyisoprenoid-binding protein YceI